MRFTCRTKEPSLSNSTPARMKQAGSARSREKKFLSQRSMDQSGHHRNLLAGWIGRFSLRKRSKPMRCPQSCALALSVFLVRQIVQGAEQPADLVVLNGKIVTVNPQSSIVEAAAVREGRFVAVGANSKVKKLVGDRTRVIDARGKTVVPGLIETHVHAIGVARDEAVQPFVQLSCCQGRDERDIFNHSRFRWGCGSARGPGADSNRDRTVCANRGSAEGSHNQSQLFYGWQRQGGLFNGLAHLERFPGLGNRWFSPAFQLCGLRED